METILAEDDLRRLLPSSRPILVVGDDDAGRHILVQLAQLAPPCNTEGMIVAGLKLGNQKLRPTTRKTCMVARGN